MSAINWYRRVSGSLEGASAAGGIGPRALFMFAYLSAASSIYFALGLIAGEALGLTPVVFLAAGLFFGVTLMTYAEGSSLHIERGGASSFARYAFNEFWSFIAGWAILLDYAIIVALLASTVPEYLGVFWGPLGDAPAEDAMAVAIIAAATYANIRGVTAESVLRALPFGLLDMVLQATVVVLGLTLLWQPDRLIDTVNLGSAPTWGGLFTGLILATVAYTGAESAAGLAGEIRINRSGLRSSVGAAAAAVMTLFVGVSLVALMAAPVELGPDGSGTSALAGARVKDAPMIGVVRNFDPSWLGEGMAYLVGAVAALTLIQAARINMFGPTRISYALATNCQIPSVIGRLHPRYGTPVVSSTLIAALAAGLALMDDVKVLLSIYAFGALLTFAIAHLSICVLRYREPSANPAYRVPFSIKLGRGRLPLPAAFAFAAATAGWVGVVLLRENARLAGGAWLALGIVLYVVYRGGQGRSLGGRVTVPEADLRKLRSGASYGSILVPVFGGVLDDDIVGTAGRLAMDYTDVEGGAVIEALHVIEIPMTQPIDAPVPEERLRAARRILARAKEVGEEYAGVEVATATVRARATGEAIVREAVRRGVEAIVLAAERPSRIRGGTLLGGFEPAHHDFIGKVTEYVTRKAPCRVILTAPPEHDAEALAASVNQRSFFRTERLGGGGEEGRVNVEGPGPER